MGRRRIELERGVKGFFNSMGPSRKTVGRKLVEFKVAEED
jgi:hypothetical protein